MSKYLSLMLCIAISGVACSNKQIYEGVQTNRKQQCDSAPNEAARQECLRGLDTKYEEYERERKNH